MSVVGKSFLVQRFAKLNLGLYHVIGYSVAGEETVVQAPEFNVCFDIGRGPQFALSSDIVCITHGHMDHLAGIAYYASQRYFQGMKPGTILVPRELHRSVDRLLQSWRDVERQHTPYTLVPMEPGQMYEVRRDFGIRALATHHGGSSLGYVLVSIREKLRPEFTTKTGPELVELKKQGIEIQYRLEVPQVAFLGDTTVGSVFDHPDVQNAETLITECTFFDPDHRAKAKHGKHTHVDQFVPLLAKLKNKHLILTHVSRRTGIGRAKRILKKLLPRERLANVHFLMDLEDATNAGDIEDTLPPPPDGAEA
jgi:ribonuclease Z